MMTTTTTTTMMMHDDDDDDDDDGWMMMMVVVVVKSRAFRCPCVGRRWQTGTKHNYAVPHSDVTVIVLLDTVDFAVLFSTTAEYANPERSMYVHARF